MKKNYILKLVHPLVWVIILSSCHEVKEPISVRDVSLKNIQVSSLELDSFYLSGDVLTSCIGELNIYNNKLYFADKMLASVDLYDTNGHFIERKLTKGRGLQEIPGLDYSLPMDKGFFVMFDYNTYFYCKDWKKQYTSRLDFQEQRSFNEVKSKPKPHYQEMYEVNWGSSVIRQLDSIRVIIPVSTSHPKINAFFAGQETFYNETYILGILNITDGKIESMFGRRPSIYLEKKYRYIPNLKHVHFDVKGDNLFIGYEPDSSIYVYNIHNDYEYKFGYAGKNMNTNYATTKDFETAEANLRSDRKKYGYYHYLEYIEQTGLIFRGYKRGSHSKKDGLQIYKDSTLIAHLEVPEHFKVIGYIEPYYYAQGYIDEYNGTVQVYKFKLPD